MATKLFVLVSVAAFSGFGQMLVTPQPQPALPQVNYDRLPIGLTVMALEPLPPILHLYSAGLGPALITSFSAQPGLAGTKWIAVMHLSADGLKIQTEAMNISMMPGAGCSTNVIITTVVDQAAVATDEISKVAGRITAQMAAKNVPKGTIQCRPAAPTNVSMPL